MENRTLQHHFLLTLLSFCALTGFSCARAAEQVLPASVATAQHEASLPWGGAESKIVDVAGQAFSKAVQVTVTKPPANFWEAQVFFQSARAVATGEKLRLIFYARRVSDVGRIVAKVEAAQEFFSSPQLDLDANWKPFSYEMSGAGAAALGALKVLFFVGQQPQVLEIGGVQLESLGGGAPMAAATTPATTANTSSVGTPVYTFEVSKIGPFAGQYTGGEKTSGEDFAGLGWSMNLWDGAATGEGGVEVEPKSGERAVFLRTLTGNPSAQAYPWRDKPNLMAGHRYRAEVVYATNGGRGVARLGEYGKPNTLEVALDDTGGQWKTARREWKAVESGEIALALQNVASGADKTLYVKSIQILDLGGPALEELLSNIPQAPDAYHAALLKNLADKHKLPRGVSIFGATEEAVHKYFHLHGPSADAGTLKTIDVQGQPFKKALRMDVQRLSGEFWHTMLQALSPLPAKKGDVMLVTLYARGGVPNLAGSPALTGVSIKPIPGDPFGFATRDLVLTDQWEKIEMPVEVKEDRDAGKLEWISALSAKLQWIEFGGISVINFGDNVKIADLPDTAKLRRTYAGRELDAPWRKEAATRIEKHRKGDLKVLVRDANGKPVPNADVQVNMTKHAFKWGSAVVPSIEIDPIPDWNKVAHEAQSKHIFKLFNSIAVDIDLKYPYWAKKSDAEKQHVLKALKYYHDRGMAIHGHTMVWPSFANMEGLEPLKNDPAKLGAAIDAHIREIGKKTEPYCDTWDVVNEPYGNQEITRILGPDTIAHWFRVARETLPKTKLYINEGITPGSGGATEAYYYDVCKQLVESGAPVDGIGLQSHIGGSPTDIATMWNAMNKFAALKPGMELAVSEFDINFQGDTQLEGDFTRDFTTLVFSHPAMQRFTMWGFYGHYHWLKYAPLFNNDGTLRPSGVAWTDLVLKQWWTETGGKSNPRGEYTTRGFLGDYEITVTANGKTKTVQSALPIAGQAVTVSLP